MRKVLLLLNLALIIFLSIPFQVLALSDNFSADYDVTYTVKDTGVTHVSFDIKLTNKTNNYYAASYTISVGFKDIQNVKASDEDGQINPTISPGNDSKDIGLAFNRHAFGLGKTLKFNLALETKDIVVKSGKIWDINIPGLSSQSDFQSFNVHVRVPSNLGKPTYIKPAVKILGSDLNFTKDNLGKSGISISFGNAQFYKFGLTYHLKNKNLFPIQTEIALPPSTNYQDVAIAEIVPRPLNVTRDRDGNWLAKYRLSPSQSVNVRVTGKVRLELFPKKQTLSPKEKSLYLKEQPYWQTSNEEIKSLASQLKTPYAIYEYAVRNLSYDYARVTSRSPRVGAEGVLSNPKSAVCLEFTDLFIALARAAGIPAREVDGFAFTQNQKERPLSLVKDVLHAWPQYYDQDMETWVMVDPTWGNTTGGVDYFQTLDFDHFAFVIKGESSSYPVPAGGYKYEEDLNVKDVDVEISDTFPNLNQNLAIAESFVNSYFSGAKIAGAITLRNTGNALSAKKTAYITANFLKPESQKISIDSIPPYGYVTIPVNFQKPSFLTNRTDTITITLDGNQIKKSIKVSPLFLLSLIAEQFRNLSFSWGKR